MKNQNELKNNNTEKGKLLWMLMEPIVYAFSWIVLLGIASFILPKEIILNDNFLIIYTLVFMLTLITKSTSWSIGHDKFGIKGDSRSRILNYHNGELWFDLFADNPELVKDEKVKELIEYLTKKEK